MLLALIALVIGTPILWAVSVGALREARRAREDDDPREGCQAWVTVPRMGDRRYRCCEPIAPGGVWCRRHEVTRARDVAGAGPPLTNDAGADGAGTYVDEPQAVGRALAQARVGVPLAVIAVVAAVAVLVWTVPRL